MSRWHDISPSGLARWANLSLDERVSDRIADIRHCAKSLELMLDEPSIPELSKVLAFAVALRRQCDCILDVLPEPGAAEPRPSELQDLIDRVDLYVRGMAHAVNVGFPRQVVFTFEEGVTLFCEIRRLERLLGLTAIPTQSET